MSRTRPLSTLQLALALAVLLTVGVAGAVWACTPKPQNFALDPPVAAAGDQPAKVTATGQSIPNSEIAIHWNGVDGPVLAETTVGGEGHFATTFDIPESAEPGVAYIVASAEQGSAQSVARAALEVTGSGEQANTTASAWQAGPTQATSQAAHSEAGGLSTPTMAGLGMLTLGGAGLLASFTAAAAQRRRVLTHRLG